MITLSVRNPDDSTSSYDKIKIYSSTTQTGTYSLVSTVAIDLSQATEFSSGFTQYTDSSGTTSTWYEFSYYNSSTLVETTLSTAIQGGTAYLDSRIRIELQDNDTTAPNYPIFSNDEIAAARQDAVNMLYPEYGKEWVDKTVTTVQNQWTYTIPPTLYNINKIEIWDETATPFNKIAEIQAYDVVGNTLRLQNPTDVAINSGYKMYLYATKRITDSADVPSYMDEMLMAKACEVLVRHLVWDRSKYQRYTTIIRPEGGNIPSLMQMIKYYNSLYMTRRNEIKKGMPAREMTLI